MSRAVWVVAVVAAFPSVVNAQAASDEFAIERFRLAIDSNGVLDVDSASVHPHLRWSGGVFVGFAHDPLVVYDTRMSPVEALVDRRLTTGIVGAIGLFDRAELGVGIDVVGYQHGSDTSPTMKSLPAGGMGDLRLVAKVLVAKTEHVQFAVLPALCVPAGSAKGYLREAGVSFAPAIAVSSDFDRIRLAANLGYRLRKRVEVAGLVSDDEVFARAGAGYRIASIELYASSSIATPISDRSSNQIAVEALAGASLSITPKLSAFAAGGAGLENGFGVPDWRALAGVRFDASRSAPARIAVAVPVEPKAEPPTVVEPPKPAIATLGGRVVDREGHPIARATVTIAGTDVATDDDGRFSSTYTGGAIEVSVKAIDYQPATANAVVPPGTTGVIEVVLVRAVRQGQLRGQVLSFGGKPLAATITVTGKTTAKTQTDAEGQFSVDLPDGAFEVVIDSPGFVTQRRTVNVKFDGVTVLNVDLRGAK